MAAGIACRFACFSDLSFHKFEWINFFIVSTFYALNNGRFHRPRVPCCDRHEHAKANAYGNFVWDNFEKKLN